MKISVLRVVIRYLKGHMALGLIFGVKTFRFSLELTESINYRETFTFVRSGEILNAKLDVYS